MTTFRARLDADNNSGVSGTVVVKFNEDEETLTVHIEASGLTPDEIHPQHIHGFRDGSPSELPTIELDRDLDGFVETPEARDAIGRVLLSLTESGDITRRGGDDFPTADENGRLDFRQTYQFDLDNPREARIFEQLQDRLDGRAVELHGEEVPDGEGARSQFEVNGEGGYIQEVPVATGILHEVDDHHHHHHHHSGMAMA